MAKVFHKRVIKRLQVEERKIEIKRISKFLGVSLDPFALNKYTGNSYSRYIKYGGKNTELDILVKQILQAHFIKEFSGFDVFRVPRQDFEKCVYYTLLEIERNTAYSRAFIVKHNEILKISAGTLAQDTPVYFRRNQVIDLLKNKYNQHFLSWPSVSVFDSEIYEYILNDHGDPIEAIESDILENFLRSRTLYSLCSFGVNGVVELDSLKRQTIRLYLEHGHILPMVIVEILEKRGLMPNI